MFTPLYDISDIRIPTAVEIWIVLPDVSCHKPIHYKHDVTKHVHS